MVGAVSHTCLPYTLDAYKEDDLEANPLVCPTSCVNSAIPFAPASNRIPNWGQLFSDEEVISALQQGPVFAAMRVTDKFMKYRCGVFCGRPLSPSRGPNHAVEIVDYSSSSYPGTPYWVVKNSWGTERGEDGYYRIARGQNQLTAFVAITMSGSTQLDASSPLSTPTCAAEAPSDDSDNELLESAAEYAIEVLNNRNEIRCAQEWPL